MLLLGIGAYVRSDGENRRGSEGDTVHQICNWMKTNGSLYNAQAFSDVGLTEVDQQLIASDLERFLEDQVVMGAIPRVDEPDVLPNILVCRVRVIQVFQISPDSLAVVYVRWAYDDREQSGFYLSVMRVMVHDLTEQTTRVIWVPPYRYKVLSSFRISEIDPALFNSGSPPRPYVTRDGVVIEVSFQWNTPVIEYYDYLCRPDGTVRLVSHYKSTDSRLTGGAPWSTWYWVSDRESMTQAGAWLKAWENRSRASKKSPR